MPYLIILGLFVWILYKAHIKNQKLVEDNQRLMNENKDLTNKLMELYRGMINR